MDRSLDGWWNMRLWLKMKIMAKYGTQRAFAGACQKSENWVSGIVLGLRNPSREEADLIIEKLGLDQTDKLFLQG